MREKPLSCLTNSLYPSDDLGEKELDIKLDITKKSRKINRPVSFADQQGGYFDLCVHTKMMIHPVESEVKKSLRRLWIRQPVKRVMKSCHIWMK